MASSFTTACRNKLHFFQDSQERLPLIGFLMIFLGMLWTIFLWPVMELATFFWGETSMSMEYNGRCLSTLLTIVTLIHGKRCLRYHLHFTRDCFQVHAVSTIERITFHGTHSRHFLFNMMNMTHDTTKAYSFPRAAERRACQSKFCCKPKRLAKLIFPRWDQRLMD